MKFGLDMTSPPTVEQAAQMAQLGYTFCICYIGGPRAAAHSEWHIIDGQRYPVGDLAPYFPDGFLPCYVARNVPWDNGSMFTARQGFTDAADACADTGACGFDSTSPIWVDIEYGTYETYPASVKRYLAAFIGYCNSVGHPVGVYGGQTLLAVLQNGVDVDGKWGADQIHGNVYNAEAGFWSGFDPGSPPPWQVWQCGNGTAAGVGVDYNTATEDALLAHYAL